MQGGTKYVSSEFQIRTTNDCTTNNQTKRETYFCEQYRKYNSTKLDSTNGPDIGQPYIKPFRKATIGLKY